MTASTTPENVDPDALWGTTAPAPASSFTDVNVITAETEEILDEDRSGESDEAPEKKKGKNYGILAAAVAIILALLGGVAWMVMDQLSTPVSKKIEPVENVAAPQVASVFDKTDKTPAPTALPVTEATGAAALPAVVVAPAIAVAAPTLPATAVPPTAPAVPVATVATTAAPVVAVVATAAKPEQAKAIEAPKEVIEPPVNVVKTKYTKKRPVKKRQSEHATRLDRVDERSTKAALSTPVMDDKPASKKNDEVLMLPKGLKVTSIYPQVGVDVQAWLTDGAGRLEVVRVGDTLVNGIQIIKITPETGEVFTSAGVITNKGAGK
jgi:hypothetical protein